MTKTKKTKKKLAAQSLIDALEFVKPITKANDETPNRFCRIRNNMLEFSNGPITMGMHVDEDFEAYPNARDLLSTLKETGENLSIAVVPESHSLSIISDDFAARVPCWYKSHVLAFEKPIQENPQAQVDNRLKQACTFLHKIPLKKSDDPRLKVVNIRSQTAVATNKEILIEYFHGGSFPSMNIPTDSAKILSKCKKDLTGIGFNESGVTFWFEDDSYFHTILLPGDYINYLDFFKAEEFMPIEENFFSALKKLKPLTVEDKVYFNLNKISTNPEDGIGSTVDVLGVPGDMIFNIKHLDHFKNSSVISFNPERNAVEFRNEIMRGVVMGIKKAEND